TEVQWAAEPTGGAFFTALGSASSFPQCVGMTSYNSCINAGVPANRCRRAFGSMHPGGMYFGFCDGSVRFVTRNIDIVLFQGLATVSGAGVGLERVGGLE